VIIGNQFHPAPSESRTAKSASKLTDGFGSPNRFLFAEVGVQQNGMALSVLSMLSRQDVDPWDEAAHLAACSTREAVTRLAARVAAASTALANPRDPSAVAVDLIRLLPSRSSGLPSSLLPRGATDHDLLFGAGGKPPKGRRREGGSSPSGARSPHPARVLAVCLASVTWIAIMATAPQHVRSFLDGGKPTVSTTQQAAPPVVHPSRWFR
jgi:hypothetical protein